MSICEFGNFPMDDLETKWSAIKQKLPPERQEKLTLCQRACLNLVFWQLGAMKKEGFSAFEIKESGIAMLADLDYKIRLLFDPKPEFNHQVSVLDLLNGKIETTTLSLSDHKETVACATVGAVSGALIGNLMAKKRYERELQNKIWEKSKLDGRYLDAETKLYDAPTNKLNSEDLKKLKELVKKDHITADDIENFVKDKIKKIHQHAAAEEKAAEACLKALKAEAEVSAFKASEAAIVSNGARAGFVAGGIFMGVVGYFLFDSTEAH